MAHQVELEKRKYRNWVRAVLAYKYLRCGIEGFADAVARQEHERILKLVKEKPDFKQLCNTCDINTLKPKHERKEKKCPWKLTQCNCLKHKTPTKECDNHACDVILEDIIRSHGSSPPAPNLKNTNTEKWCTSPWEIAKCFIKAPGYREKTDVSDIDIAGLLHVFIKNIHFQERITNVDIFEEVLEKRNMIFHTKTMELDDKEMSDCIDDIVLILEDGKELKARHESQQSVVKLRQMKQQDFIITTQTEEEAHEEFLCSISKKIQEFKHEVNEANSNFDSKVQKANSDFDTSVQNASSVIYSRVQKANSDFVSKINEAKSDIDRKLRNAKSDIDCKIKEAKSAHHSLIKAFVTQNKKPSDRQTQELKHAMVEQKELKTQLELVKTRLIDQETYIESLVASMQRSCDVKQKQREYEEKKQVMQRILHKHYQKKYVKTWVSPLRINEDDININKVYVWPDMVVEKKSNPNEYENSVENPVSHNSESMEIKGYHQVFQTNDVRHRKIYIVGDIGTGKSSFCKMMIYDWCKSVEEPNDEATIQSDNIKEMKSFEFLFFITLRGKIKKNGVQVNDILEMIKTQYPIISPKFDECLNRIFEEESERCLVIVDGLDEWTPSKCTLGYVSYGLPGPDRIQNATLVTLSRRSAIGILNMKFSEYDQKIEMKGIKKIDLHKFVTQYMSILRSEWHVYPFLNRVKLAKLEHLEKTPFVLQQLINTYCKNNTIGKSVSDIYSQMVNLMCCWSKRKNRDSKAAPAVVNEEHISEQKKLPKILRKYPNWRANEILLITLGKAAFNALTADEPTTIFGRFELQESYGLLDGDISKLLRFGILAENNSFDREYEETCLSFIHISYLEFFAAVYIASIIPDKPDEPDSETPDEPDSEESVRSVLKKLFIKYKSVADVLRLSQMLKMLCSLCPNLTADICQFISNNMAIDESMIGYRTSIRSNMLSSYTVLKGNELVFQVQTLLIDCLSQCDVKDLPVINLCDILIDSKFSISILSKLKPSDIISVKYITEKHLDKVFEWIDQLTNLQYLYINTNEFTTPSQKYNLLCALLQKNVSLKSLRVSCKYQDSESHFFDLSRHNQLQSIQLHIDLVNTNFSLNLNHLEVIKIFDDRYFAKTWDIMMPVYVIPKMCNHTFCEGHSSEDKQIQNVLENIGFEILVPATISKSLERATIPHIKDINHDFYQRLTEAVNQATSLKQVSLGHGKCNRDNCTSQSHRLDLSRHNQLQSLGLSSNILVSGINAASLTSLQIGGLADAYPLLSHCESSKLTYLGIHQLSSYTSQMNLVVQTLQHLKRLSLRFVNIKDNALTVSPKMKNLCEIELDEVEIRFQAWCSFSRSLLVPKQRILVHASRFDVPESVKEAMREYVEQSRELKVIFTSNQIIRFRSNI